jgi:hypothetical protein
MWQIKAILVSATKRSFDNTAKELWTPNDAYTTLLEGMYLFLGHAVHNKRNQVLKIE